MKTWKLKSQHRVWVFEDGQVVVIGMLRAPDNVRNALTDTFWSVCQTRELNGLSTVGNFRPRRSADMPLNEGQVQKLIEEFGSLPNRELPKNVSELMREKRNDEIIRKKAQEAAIAAANSAACGKNRPDVPGHVGTGETQA